MIGFRFIVIVRGERKKDEGKTLTLITTENNRCFTAARFGGRLSTVNKHILWRTVSYKQTPCIDLFDGLLGVGRTQYFLVYYGILWPN